MQVSAFTVNPKIQDSSFAIAIPCQDGRVIAKGEAGAEVWLGDPDLFFIKSFRKEAS